MARFGKDMFTYASADLLGSSIGLLLSPVFTRLFTPAQYGAQAALAAAWSFVALAQFGGMDSAYPNFRSRTTDENERRRLAVSATWIAIASVFITSGAFAAVCLWVDGVREFAAVSRHEALCYVLTLAPGGVMAWFLYVLRFERRATAFARVSLLGRVLGVLVLVPALMWSPVTERLAVSFMVTAFATGIAALLGAYELARGGVSPLARPLYDLSAAKAMLRFGIVLVPAGAIYAASTVLDRLLVTWFSGPAETAVLALALRLGAIAAMLKTWFALVWDPQLIEWVASEPHERLLKRLNGAIDIIARGAAVLACVTAIWAGPVVTVLYPESYWMAAALLPWIVLSVGVATLSLVAVATTVVARTAKLHLPVYAIGLAVNLTLSLWLVPQFGAGGAVAGLLAAETTVLAAWILIGGWHLKNLRLRWSHRLWLLGLTAGFAAIIGHYISVTSPAWAERGLVTVAVLFVLGIPLGRKVAEMRKQTQRSQI